MAFTTLMALGPSVSPLTPSFQCSLNTAAKMNLLTGKRIWKLGHVTPLQKLLVSPILLREKTEFFKFTNNSMSFPFTSLISSSINFSLSNVLPQPLWYYCCSSDMPGSSFFGSWHLVFPLPRAGVTNPQATD